MSKTEHWCGTCGQLRKLLELAAKEIEKLTPEEKASLRQDLRRQFGIPESDADFLKQCGIDPDG